MNLGQGIKGFVLGQAQVFGSDYIEIETKVPSTNKTSPANAIGQAQGITITTLKLKDAEAIAKEPNIRGYYAGQVGQQVASFGAVNKTSLLWGTTAGIFEFSNFKVAQGRGFTTQEDKSQARVVVLGSKIKNDFFGKAQAVGKRIKLGSKKFTVVGVMQEKGAAFFMDMDSMIFVPLRTIQKQILGINHIQFITAYVYDTDKVATTAQDITSLMRDQHQIADPTKDDFSVTTSDEALSLLGNITGGINMLLLAIAAISLLVGGVGIMNIMYVSVSERTYEIGLRKALGATKQNILWQFLWEAVFLTILGGLLGVILGTLFSWLAAYGAQAAGFDWQFSPSFIGLVIAVGFSVLVGLIFGVYPAKKAAKMQPVEALRSE